MAGSRSSSAPFRAAWASAGARTARSGCPRSTSSGASRTSSIPGSTKDGYDAVYVPVDRPHHRRHRHPRHPRRRGRPPDLRRHPLQLPRDHRRARQLRAALAPALHRPARRRGPLPPERLRRARTAVPPSRPASPPPTSSRAGASTAATAAWSSTSRAARPWRAASPCRIRRGSTAAGSGWCSRAPASSAMSTSPPAASSRSASCRATPAAWPSSATTR